jgi:hypothetical protein
MGMRGRSEARGEMNGIARPFQAVREQVRHSGRQGRDAQPLLGWD